MKKNNLSPLKKNKKGTKGRPISYCLQEVLDQYKYQHLTITAVNVVFSL